MLFSSQFPSHQPSFLKSWMGNLFGYGLSCAVLAAIAGCAVGPNYKQPKVDAPPAFKEAAGDWIQAEPQDGQPRGPWWEIFGDETLNGLEAQVDVSNQNIKVAEAQYRQAVAAANVARSAFFPQITLDASATREQAYSLNALPGVRTTTATPAGGTTGGATGGTTVVTTGSKAPTGTVYSASLDATWELDIWGRVRRQYEAGRAAAQATAADLESLRLSTQAQLAQNYFLMRAADSQVQLLDDTVKAFEHSLKITQDQYKFGIVTRADVVQAETQLKTTQALRLSTQVQRAQLEHSLATLTGKPPSELSLPAAPLTAGKMPPVPTVLPSELLQRRPDVASAERRVIEANADVGVARAAFFPSLSLSAAGGYESVSTANFFSLPNRFWSIGPSLAQTVFAGGRLRAQSAQAVAAYDASVATYRQTVLAGFQEVEDNLVAAHLLDESVKVQTEAVAAARDSVTLAQNQYKAGTVSFLSVATVQATALDAERNLAQTMGQQLATSITLIKAVGGGWDGRSLDAALKK